MKWNNPDPLRIKGHWHHLFWKFWVCDEGESYDFIPLFFGICWERDMKLRKEIGNELDRLRMYVFNNFVDNEHRHYVCKCIQKLECKAYGKDIF